MSGPDADGVLVPLELFRVVASRLGQLPWEDIHEVMARLGKCQPVSIQAGKDARPEEIERPADPRQVGD